jgi:hypothetical protein
VNQPISFKNKTLASFLAACLGVLGAHRFYLEGAGGLRPWIYPGWSVIVGSLVVRHLFEIYPDFPAGMSQVLHPLTFVALLPAFAGYIEALVIALTPDARWDARHNAQSDRKSHSGALAIVVAVLTLAGAMIVLLTALSIWSEAYMSGFGSAR